MSSPGTPASSTTKTGRHHIAEILLKVALNTINHIIIIINQYKQNKQSPLTSTHRTLKVPRHLTLEIMVVSWV
jgi:hypothetical protein